jgi:hypothetical protein
MPLQQECFATDVFQQKSFSKRMHHRNIPSIYGITHPNSAMILNKIWQVVL